MGKKFIELAEPIKGPIILRDKVADWLIGYLKTHPSNPGWIKQRRKKDKEAIRCLEKMGIVIRRANDLNEIAG